MFKNHLSTAARVPKVKIPMVKGGMENIRKRLADGESVVMYAQQGRLKPGGAGAGYQHTIFITEKRIIIWSPRRLGFGEFVEEYFYKQITNIMVEKGIFLSSLIFHVPGMTEESKTDRKIMRWNRDDNGTIDAIPKKSAEKIYMYAKDKIIEGNRPQKNRDPESIHPSSNDEDLIDILKARYVRGEITEEEFDRMKDKIGG
ncbi:putative Short C-terminal domain [Nitrosopumilaceae archaeon]|nr:putative Short C-terminal domain [Nitrosopumilaceae archaeon]